MSAVPKTEMESKPSTARAPQHRMLQLDLLRGIAILLVLQRHFTYDPLKAGVLTPLAYRWEQVGWTGVDLFFVLSGFLVGGLMFKEIRTRGSLDVRRFLIRRGFKIWPAYYLYLVALFIILLFIYHGELRRPMLMMIPPLVHLQDYRGTYRGHLWSLAVEEHFYLLLPLLLTWLLSRRKDKGPIRSMPEIPRVALFLAIFCLTIRCFVTALLPYREETHYCMTHIRMDSLFFGVLLAYLFHFHSDWLRPLVQRRGLLMVVGLALVLPFCWIGQHDPIVTTIGYTMLFLGYGCILLAVVHTPIRPGLFGMSGPLTRLIAWIGVYSYSIYLWHIELGVVPMQWWLARPEWSHIPLSMRWPLALAVYLAFACLGGFGMAKLIELPSLKLRDRFFPARSEAI